MEKPEQVIEAEIIEAVPALTEQVIRGEIYAQVSTARAYPRSVKDFLDTATELATYDEDVAGTMHYSLPGRKGGDGKAIEGESIRLAEIAVYAWGNCRAEWFVESIDERSLTVAGVFFDVERNAAYKVRVVKSIWGKKGRYGDEMIATTARAAGSIAYREAVFKGIPRVFIKRIARAAYEAAVGTQATLTERRSRALVWFKEQGVQEKTLLEKLKRRSVDEITLDDLGVLTGIRTAIREEGMTVAEAFAEEEEQQKVDELNKTLKSLQEKKNGSSKKTDLPAGTYPTVKDPTQEVVEPVYDDNGEVI